jgi:hypothetical protein
MERIIQIPVCSKLKIKFLTHVPTYFCVSLLFFIHWFKLPSRLRQYIPPNLRYAYTISNDVITQKEWYLFYAITTQVHIVSDKCQYNISNYDKMGVLLHFFQFIIPQTSFDGLLSQLLTTLHNKPLKNIK